MTNYAETPRWKHQIEDTRFCVNQPYRLLGNEPGTGKSRIVVDTADELFFNNEIDQLLVVCPAPARSVWLDPDPILGEFAKWAPPRLSYTVEDYSTQSSVLAPPSGRSKFLPHLRVVVTNPEFLRRVEGEGRHKSRPRLAPLRDWARSKRTMLIADESWQYQSPKAQQSKALYLLRTACTRAYLLNGTPGEIKNLFTQYQILSPDILRCDNWFQFRGRYCLMGGYMNKEVVGYQREDEFRELTAPYTSLRIASECQDLGPEPVRTHLDVRLTPKTWKLYREMEDDMFAWVSKTDAAVAQHAGTVAMRLAQITNGFVGGVEEDVQGDLYDEGRDPEQPEVREIGREKLDGMLEWMAQHWPQNKLVIFTRFRPDVERTQRVLQDAYPLHVVKKIYGMQGRKAALEERERAKMLLAPGGDPAPAIVVANTQSGGAGLNFAASQICAFMANDYSLKTRVQAEKRVYRPGQTGRVTFLDVLASGPNGERTIDHLIVANLRRKEDMQVWTAERWRAALLSLRQGPSRRAA